LRPNNRSAARSVTSMRFGSSFILGIENDDSPVGRAPRRHAAPEAHPRCQRAGRDNARDRDN
jgi:hypothetical protein